MQKIALVAWRRPLEPCKEARFDIGKVFVDNVGNASNSIDLSAKLRLFPCLVDERPLGVLGPVEQAERFRKDANAQRVRAVGSVIPGSFNGLAKTRASHDVRLNPGAQADERRMKDA